MSSPTGPISSRPPQEGHAYLASPISDGHEPDLEFYPAGSALPEDAIILSAPLTGLRAGASQAWNALTADFVDVSRPVLNPFAPNFAGEQGRVSAEQPSSDPSEFSTDPAAPEDREYLVDAAMDEVKRAEYSEMFEPYKLLRDTLEAMAYFAASKEGGAKPDLFNVIDLERAEVYQRSGEPDLNDPNKIFLPVHDPNLSGLIEASSDILANLKEKRISLEDARKAIDERKKDFEAFDSGRISDRAHEYRSKLHEIKKEITSLEAERKFLILQCQNARKFVPGNDYFVSGGDWASKVENGRLPELERKIAESKREAGLVEITMRGLAKTLAIQESMLALAEGSDADDVLHRAGFLMGTLDLDREAFEYYSQAREIALKQKDELSAKRHELYVVKHDTGLTDEKRYAAYLSYRSSLDDKFVRFCKNGGPSEFVRIAADPEISKKLNQAVDDEVASLRAEALGMAVQFAADKAKDNPKDRLFVEAVGLLDKAISDATARKDISGGEFLHLTAAATAAIEPYHLLARDYAGKAKLSERNELIDGLWARATRIETLYDSLSKSRSDEAKDEVLANIMGRFGAATYFYSVQDTGFPYQAALAAFNWFVPRYPDSEAKENLVRLVRSLAPHLFRGMDFLPVGMHRPAPDAEMAGNEMELLHLLPGSVWRQIGVDFGSGVAGATLGAKICGAGGAAGGPVGAIGGGGACALAGGIAGTFGGAAAMRVSYADEIAEMKHQAMMAGMSLSSLNPGEGYKALAMTCLAFAVGTALIPGGTKFSVKLGNRLIEIASPSGLSWLGKELNREVVKKTARLIPMAVRGVGGLLGVIRKNGNQAALLSVAEQMGTLLGVGKRTVDQSFDAVTRQIVQGIEESLVEHLGTAMKGNVDLARGFVRGLVADPKLVASRMHKLHDLLKRVSRGKIKRDEFLSGIANICGKTDEDEVVKALTAHVFNSDAGLRATAKRFLDAVEGPHSGGRSFVERLAVTLGKNDEELFAKLAQDIGPLNIPKLLKLFQVFQVEGARVIQMERLVKWLVRDQKTAAQILDAMLTSSTREEMVEEALKMGVRIDRHALRTMLSGDTRQALHSAVRDVFAQGATRVALGRKGFAKAVRNLADTLEKIGKGDDARFLKHLGFVADDMSQGALDTIARDPQVCRRFVEIVLGKGLAKKDLRKLPPTVRKLFLDVIVKPEEQTAASKALQHVMKDAVRPTLMTWRTANLSDITDVSVRAGFRVAHRLLDQSIVLADEAGEDFAKTIFSEYMAPWHLARYHTGDAARSGSKGTLFEQAFAQVRSDMRGLVSGELVKAIRFRPEHGVLDRFLRPFNRAYDFVARPVDRLFSRRLEVASEIIRAAHPDSVLHINPVLYRKMLLRQAYLERQAAEEAQRLAERRATMAASQRQAFDESEKLKKMAGDRARDVGFDESAHPVITRLMDGYEWMATRFGTEEFRMGHRICIPVALEEEIRGRMNGGNGMGELGIICTMVGANYYMQKAGLSNTHALDIAIAQRTLGTALSKIDADSNDWLDVRRTGATYAEAAIALMLQSYAMYGLNFAAKLPLGRVSWNLPLINAFPVAMNSSPFFRVYRGSLDKMDFLGGSGFGGAMAGIGFTTVMSIAQSGAIASIIQGDKFMRASPDYIGWTMAKYAVNGPVVNAPGFMVNKYLEANNPDADLRSTLRQLVERVLGTGTQYLMLQFFDPYAGRGDYKAKEDDLLSAAASGRKKSARKAVRVFLDRYALDLVGGWTKLDQRGWWHGMDPRRTGSINPGASYNLLQLKSWSSEDRRKTSDGKMRQGYFVDLARNNPASLNAFLDGFEEELSDPRAKWRSSFWSYKRRVHSKGIYHFSLMAKYYAHLAVTGQPEFKPFADYLKRSKYQEYWSLVPTPRNEDDLQLDHILMEDFESVDVEKKFKLEDLIAHLRCGIHPKHARISTDKLSIDLSPITSQGNDTELRDKGAKAPAASLPAASLPGNINRRAPSATKAE